MASYTSRGASTFTEGPNAGTPTPTWTSRGPSTFKEGPNAGGTPDIDNDAFAVLKQTLSDYGLDSLTGFVYDALVNGKSEAEIMRDLRNQPEFAARFPAIVEREKNGLPPISPAEYITYERQAAQLMRAAGLPKGFYDNPDDFTKFLAGDTSLAELSQRINLARDAAYNAPPETVTALRQMGLSDGDLTAYWLDPDRAEPLLEQKFRAATISGTAARTGFGYLTATEADRLAKEGVTDTQAQQAFGTLASNVQLFGALDSGEDQITREEQLAAGFENSAQAQKRIEDRRRRRQAVFQGGGSVLDSQKGAEGLADTTRR